MSETKDAYKTIKKSSEGFFKDRGSKFFAYAYPMTSEIALKEQIDILKKTHHTARHHCYAYRFKQDYSIYRANDDGEPTHAAGKPILGQIDAKELTQIAVVVVRYFGGTKLGVGGMMNAYKQAALDALNHAEIVECTIDDVFEVSFGYPEMNTVMRFIKDLGVDINKQIMDLNCKIQFNIRRNDAYKAIEKFSGLKNIEIKKLEK